MGRESSAGKLDTVIGPETAVKGDLRVTGSMRLDGFVEGRVDVTETLLTGPRSRLKGEARCRDGVIAGAVEGNLTASESVELQSGAQVFGDITCRGLVIQRDCVFDGRCAMTRDQTGPASQ